MSKAFAFVAAPGRAEARRDKDWMRLFDELRITYLSGNYINEDSVIEYICPECKLEDAARISCLRNRSSGCMYCAGCKIDDPLELFYAKDLIPLESYKNALSPLSCICKRCGEPTSPARNNLQ